MKSAKTRQIVEETLHAWARRDLQATMRHMAEAVVHSLNIDASLAPYAASVVGRREVERKLGAILDAFDFDVFDVTSLAADKDRARAAVALRYRHRATGQQLVTTVKFNFTLRQDRIVLIEETHDAENVEAYLRMIKSLAAAKSS